MEICMDMRNLQTFLYVAELSSFTRAAEVLRYSQSTVSFQIKQLERELNVTLFDRVNHTVTLTAKGREVLKYAQDIINMGNELERYLRADQAVSGHVRIAMADSICPSFLGEGFAEFRRQYPGITLKIITAGTKEMLRLLNRNEADLVITLDNHTYHMEYVIAQEKKIGTHFIASTNHPFANVEDLSVRDLLHQPFVLTERGMSYRRLMDELLAERSMEVSPALELGNTDQICQLVEQNVGISFLPDYATEEAVQNGRIVRLAVKDIEIEVWKQLLYHRDKWISPAMQKVMEYCAARE